MERLPSHNKQSVVNQVTTIIKEGGFHVVDTDLDRPWGGFYRLDNSDAELFAGMYFPELQLESYENLSPKFLLVAPGMRLSWQRHFRRAELWKVLQGPVGIKISHTDDEPEELVTLESGQSIQFDANVCHRLIGLSDKWGIVAGIWKHVDGANPSDEADIVRIQDDFGR